MKYVRIFIIALTVFAYQSPFAETFLIPVDYPTIQEGVDACTEGDTVLIKPGIYHEFVDIYDVNIVLGSLFITTGNRDYIYTTIIDGDSIRQVMLVFIFVDTNTVISGLTLRNGYRSDGAGVLLCSGILENCVIKDNVSYNSNSYHGGAGVNCWDSTIIRNNIIINNTSTGPSGAWYSGGGIRCSGEGVKITGNVIANNSSCWGGGIALLGSDALVERNIIYENIADP